MLRKKHKRKVHASISDNDLKHIRRMRNFKFDDREFPVLMYLTRDRHVSTDALREDIYSELDVEKTQFYRDLESLARDLNYRCPDDESASSNLITVRKRENGRLAVRLTRLGERVCRIVRARRQYDADKVIAKRKARREKCVRLATRDVPGDIMTRAPAKD